MLIKTFRIAALDTLSAHRDECFRHDRDACGLGTVVLLALGTGCQGNAEKQCRNAKAQHHPEFCHQRSRLLIMDCMLWARYTVEHLSNWSSESGE